MAYSDEVLADSPVGYWRLDDTSGTVAEDATANNRDGTYVGSPTLGTTSLLPAGGGTAVALDGSTQRVSIAHNAAFNLVNANGFTFECWVKLDDPDAALLQNIADKTNTSTASAQWEVWYDNRNVGAGTVRALRFRYNGAASAILTWDTATEARDALAAGGHLVCVMEPFPGSTVRMYWNGVQVKTMTHPGGTPGSSTQTLSLGARSDGTGFRLDGILDEVAVYQSALSAARVAAHYAAAAGSGGIEPPTLGLTFDTLAPGVPVVAPVLSLSLDTLAPTVTTPPIQAPLLTLAVDTLDPLVPVSAPLLQLAIDTRNPSIPGLSVEAPLLTLDVDLLAPFIGLPLALSLDFGGSPSLDVALSPATPLSLDFGGSPSLNVILTRPSTIDPVTGLPQYRLVAVAADGTRLGELPNAEIGDLVEELGLDGTSVDFALPKYDATNRYVLPEQGDPIPEVQVWRGPNLETWQKVDGARPTTATIEYDCSGLGTHLGDRLIGRIPKKDWLVNGDFSAGFTGWTFGYDDGSIPASQPKRSIVDVDFFGTKAKALKLSGADKITTTKRTLETAAVFVPNEATFLSGGAALITSEAEQIPDGTTSILIEGHTAYNWLDGDYGDGLALSLARANAAKPYVQAVHPDATITTVGKGRFEPLNDNSTYEEQAVNRRVEFHYSTTVTADADSAQWAKGSLTVGATYTNPKSTKRALPVTFFGWALLTNFLSESKTGYGVHVSIAKASAPTVIIAEESSELNASTPTDDWVRHEASVDIPADGIAYIVSVKFYAPGGDVLWTHGGVYPEEALHYPAGTDRALIVKGLVEHAQDPDMGKLGDTPFLIGTRTPLTGSLTKATYPFHERREVLDAVNEHAAVAHGVDLRLGHSDTERWVETHYPRLGSITKVTLALGTNIIAYESPIDVASSGTRWIAQALESSGADREEGIYTDTSGLGGVLVERLAYAEPGTPVTELYGAAEKSGKRYGHPVSDLTVTIGKIGAPDPALTSWMLDHVKVGDVVTVDIQDGPIVHAGPHRVVRKVLTPESDTLRYSLIPEV